MIKDFFVFSFTGMRKRKLRSWLTLLGIFIGIAAVVSLISLGNGLRTAVEGQFSSISADTLTIQNAGSGFGPPGSTAVAKLTDHDVKLIESVNGVKLVIPRLIRITKVEYNKNVNFQYTVSMPEDKTKMDRTYTNLGLQAQEGRLLNVNDHGKVLLGSDFESKDLFGKQITPGSKIIVNGKAFTVVGIQKKTSSFIFNQVAFMLDSDMKDALGIKDEWDTITAQVQNKNDIEKVADDISNKLRKDRHEKVGEEDFTVQTPVQSLSAVNTILNIINIIVVGIASISLLIGGIGIANTMYTAVLERTREIGTMKAIGAKNSDILQIFVIESGLFGLVGGIAGAIFGVFLSFIVSAGADAAFGQNIFAFQISWPLIIGAIGFSFLIGILAGLIPSFQASKLKPVDALRQ